MPFLQTWQHAQRVIVVKCQTWTMAVMQILTLHGMVIVLIATVLELRPL